MVPVRKTCEIGDGVKVDLLFTPHLSVYQEGLEPLRTSDKEDASFVSVMEQYADIFYCAALNAWELDGKGTQEDFPLTRGDFHGWMNADPKGFTAAVTFAVTALTGKSPRDVVREAKDRSDEKDQKEEKKKKGWFYRLTHR